MFCHRPLVWKEFRDTCQMMYNWHVGLFHKYTGKAQNMNFYALVFEIIKRDI